MNFFLKHAWKELSAEPRFLLLFLLNLSLGLSGLIAVNAFRDSVKAAMDASAKTALGADLTITTRVPLSEAEKSSAAKTLGQRPDAASVDMSSMLNVANLSRLVSLKAVSPAYPLYKGLKLKKRGELLPGAAATLAQGKVWVSADLAAALEIKSGDSLRLGEHVFTVDDLIVYDPQQSFRLLATAGKVFLSLQDLPKTALVRPGSTVSYASLYKLPSAVDLEAMAKRLELGLIEPSVRINTPKDAGEDAGRMLSHLSSFLGLAALVALVLAALGANYLFRLWTQKRARVLTMHQILGLSRGQALLIPVLQALLISLLALPIAALLASMELKLLGLLTRSLSPIAIAFELKASSLLMALGLASLLSLLFCIPLLMAYRELSLKELVAGKVPVMRLRGAALVYLLPAVLSLYGLAFLQARSFRNAGIFLACIVGAALMLSVLGFLFLRLLGRLAPLCKGWILKHALLTLSRRGIHTLSAFTSLALGVLLLNLLPQVRSSINAELVQPQKLPSLFLFDIQEEQLEGLASAAKATGVALENLSPLVRAKLVSVNHIPFESSLRESKLTREEESEARFRRRGFNLSYRKDNSNAEEIVAGKALRSDNQDGGELSLEYKFAERLGLKLGDILSFDIQGVEVSGTVKNLRKVRWTSFQPNFFILFQDGFLSGAPKTYLASVPGLDESSKRSLQNMLGKKFPNISAMDVRQTVENILGLVNNIRWSLYLMAAIALFAGFTVLFSIAQSQSAARAWDLTLHKVFGASQRSLMQMLLLEFGLLSLFAAAAGALLSSLVTLLLTHFIFETQYQCDWKVLLLSILSSTLLAITVAILGMAGIWRQNPVRVLQNGNS